MSGPTQPRGLRIALYCPNKPLTGEANPSGDWATAQALQVSLRRLGHDCREASSFRARWFWHSPAGWGRAARSCLRALRWVRVFQPQVWLTHHSYYKSPDVLGPIIRRLWACRYVLVQPMFSTRRRRSAGTRTGFYLNRIALRAADHAFTNNLEDIPALLRILPRNRLSYLKPGIFPEEFRGDPEAGRRLRSELGFPAHSAVLLTVARFRPGVKSESLLYLFHSLARLAGNTPPFDLWVVGDGPMKERLQAAAAALLPGKAHFLGRVDRGVLWRYYSAADLFVFPGIGESLGMVYLEAQACGLPVVALDSPGVAQVVRDGETGVLVARDGGQAMADAVAALLRDPERRRCLGTGGFRFVAGEHDLHANILELARKLAEPGRPA
jgi:glycosyltransferase involved in cell wall biosynthesis